MRLPKIVVSVITPPKNTVTLSLGDSNEIGFRYRQLLDGSTSSRTAIENLKEVQKQEHGHIPELRNDVFSLERG